MTILWWKLDNKAKAKRSFIMAPFMLLLGLFPDKNTYFTLSSWEFACLGMAAMILQGCYYKYKHKQEH